MTMQPVSPAGMLKTINDNFEALGPVGSDDGLGSLRVARFTFDAGVAANRTAEAHGTGVTIPAQTIVVGGFVEVNTAFTGEESATLAIHVQGANDIVSAAAVAGAPWSTTGRKAIVPKANTPESTSIKLTAAREITCTVGTARFADRQAHRVSLLRRRRSDRIRQVRT